MGQGHHSDRAAHRDGAAAQAGPHATAAHRSGALSEFVEQPWRTVQLGEVFDERRETGYNDLPLLAITGDQGIIYRDELDKRDTSASDKSKYLRICPGDIGYNTMRMWQGRSAVSKLEGIVSPAYTICTPKASLDMNFMGDLFQLPETVRAFRRNSQGLVSDTVESQVRCFRQDQGHNPIPPRTTSHHRSPGRLRPRARPAGAQARRTPAAEAGAHAAAPHRPRAGGNLTRRLSP